MEDEDFTIRDSRKGGWFWVNNSVVDSAELSFRDKCVYFCLCRFVDSSSQKCYPGFKRMAQITGYGERSLHKSIAVLEECGYIGVERKKGSINRYILLKLTTAPDTVPSTEQVGGYPTNGRGSTQRIAGRVPNDEQVPYINKNYIIRTNNKNTLFEEVWSVYPKRIGKKAAKKFFLSSVKTQGDFENMKRALNNYNASKNVKDGYLQNGSTWFNNWEDWVEDPITNNKTMGASHGVAL
jgi:hypothetical protein